MYDYSDVPQNVHSFTEIKKYRKPLKGKGSFRIKEIGETKEIDKFHQAKEGKVLRYIIFEFKGDSNNPAGNKIHPFHFSETGWDPAPQFVAILNGKEKYASLYYQRAMLKKKGYQAPLGGLELTRSEWTPQVTVWQMEEKEKVTFALKYIAPGGNPHYLKVKI